MGILDKNVELKVFQNFQAEVQDKLNSLTKQVELKATDSETTAKQAAAEAVEARQSIDALAKQMQTHLEAIDSYRLAAEQEVSSISELQGKMTESVSAVETSKEQVRTTSDEVARIQGAIDNSSKGVFEKLSQIDKALGESQELPEHVAAVSSLLEEAKNYRENLGAIINHASKKKDEIDLLYQEIVGHETETPEGDSKHVDGLVDRLGSAYDDLAGKVKSLGEATDTAIEDISESHENQLSELNLSFETMLDKSSQRVDSVSRQLTALLPGAMAEGLSAAYEEKRLDEVESQKGYERAFRVAIGALVGVSIIPFFVDVYLLSVEKADLVTVIKDTPNLLFAILPLYFPFLWLAYSANKKLNLSKRLIEEYTHKAVLGKTFDGLSTQIESIKDGTGEVREDLRTKLLFTLLQVSSENPGKLITDYDKSDHPLMEALENSAKLSGSVDALSKLPGFGPLARRIAARADAINQREARKVEDGLTAQNALEPNAGSGNEQSPEAPA